MQISEGPCDVVKKAQTVTKLLQDCRKEPLFGQSSTSLNIYNFDITFFFFFFKYSPLTLI